MTTMATTTRARGLPPIPPQASCMPAPEMAYESDIGIVNGGRFDSWNSARDPGFGMAYFNRTDLPYYYALAGEHG